MFRKGILQVAKAMMKMLSNCLFLQPIGLGNSEKLILKCISLEDLTISFLFSGRMIYMFLVWQS